MPSEPESNLVQGEVRAAGTRCANGLIRCLDLGSVTDGKIGISSKRSAQPTAQVP